MAQYSKSWWYPSGDPAAAVRALVFMEDNSTLAPIFADAGLTIPLTNPTTTNGSGVLTFYATDGQYWVYVGDDFSGDSELVTVSPVVTGAVLSVNGKTGIVVLNSGDVGAIPISDVVAKGDILVGTGPGTVARLPVGPNDQALFADSATSTGLQWATIVELVDSVNGKQGIVVLDALDVEAQPIGTISAKGDLYVGIANDDTDRLGVGSDGQILAANSATSTGLNWIAPPSAPVTSVNGKTGVVLLTASDLGSVPTGRAINTVNGLTGGGDLSADRTIAPTYGALANTFAQGNDSRIVGAIQSGIMDAKGDLIAATANDTPVRLGVGVNGQVLTSDSTQTTGLIWTSVSVTGGAGDVTGPASATNNSVTRFDGVTGKLIQDSLVTLSDGGGFNLPAQVGPFPGFGGDLLYDQDTQALIFTNDQIDIGLDRQTLLLIHNDTGDVLQIGMPVYITGDTGVYPYPLTVDRAKADDPTTARAVGLCAHNIIDGTDGYVALDGIVSGYPTSTYNPGDYLYVSAVIAGALTTIKPADPNYAVCVGQVGAVDVAHGSISVFRTEAGIDTVAPVLSVNGQTGVVVLTASDVGAPPTTRAINTGTGLTGGGNLTADRTISANFGTTSGTIAQGNDARVVGAIQSTTLSAKGSLISATAAATPANVSVGTNGQVLTADSAQAAGVSWQAVPSAPVTSVNTLTGAVVLGPTQIGSPPNARTITAGTALTGGGDLSADRTISANVGTTSGTLAAGDDVRITGAQQRSTLTTKADLYVATGASTVVRQPVGSDAQVLTADSTQTSGIKWATPTAAPVTSVNTQTGAVVLTAANVGAPPTTRQVIAGTAMTGGGDLSADRTFNVNIGTAAGTAAAGDDTRITGAQQRSTLTTKADLLVATAASTTTRQAVGTDGQVLTADSVQATGIKWATPTPAPVTSVNTQVGAVVLTAANVGAPPTTRAVNTTNGLTGGGDLSADRTIQPTYGVLANTVAQGNDTRITGAIQSTTLAAKGSLISATAASTPVNVTVGTNGQVVRANSATASGLEYATLTSTDVGAQPIATIDAKGDLYAGTADNATTRLPIGTNGQLLRVNSLTGTSLEWATTGTGDVVGPAGATDEGVARFDATTGKLIQNSATTLNDQGVFTLQPNAGGVIVAPNQLYSTGDDLIFGDTASETIGLGTQQQQQVRNATGVTIPINSLVYISGNTGGLTLIPTVALAKADSLTTSRVAGITRTAIANGANGNILVSGPHFGVNTSAATVGNYVYLSDTTAGALTITRPVSPSYVVPVGIVENVNASLGILDMRIGPPDLGLGTSGRVLTQESTSPLEKRWVIQSSVGVYPRSFGFVPAGGVATARSSAVAVLNQMYLLPFMLLAPGTLSQIAFEVTGATASSVVRLGVYGTGNGTDPIASPLADFGTVASATSGIKSLGVSLAIKAGEVYYLAFVGQVAAPNLRFFTGFNPYVAVGFFPTGTTPGWSVSYTQVGVSGALPTIGALSVDQAPVVGLAF